MTDWITRLKKELDKPLPGIEAQMLMAPTLRRPPEMTLPMRDSGVLLLLYPVNDMLFTVFMKRTEYEGPHSGQISFPGGKFENGDISLIDTALREAHEELGIPPDAVEVLGKLSPLYIPVSNFKVLPVVGYLRSKPYFRTDPEEVKYLIETGLDELKNPGIVKKELLSLGNETIEIPFYDIDNHHVWGATAMILSEFLEVVRRV